MFKAKTISVTIVIILILNNSKPHLLQISYNERINCINKRINFKANDLFSTLTFIKNVVTLHNSQNYTSL